MKLVSYILVLAGLAGPAFWYTTQVPDPFYRQSAEVRAFLRNRACFDAYVRGDSSGSALSALSACGVRHIRAKGECTEFTFSFICVDSVPTLYYSPRGRDALPAGFWTGGRVLDRYFKPMQIDEHWFYCLWDQ